MQDFYQLKRLSPPDFATHTARFATSPLAGLRPAPTKKTAHAREAHTTPNTTNLNSITEEKEPPPHPQNPKKHRQNTPLVSPERPQAGTQPRPGGNPKRQRNQQHTANKTTGNTGEAGRVVRQNMTTNMCSYHARTCPLPPAGRRFSGKRALPSSVKDLAVLADTAPPPFTGKWTRIEASKALSAPRGRRLSPPYLRLKSRVRLWDFPRYPPWPGGLTKSRTERSVKYTRARRRDRDVAAGAEPWMNSVSRTQHQPRSQKHPHSRPPPFPFKKQKRSQQRPAFFVFPVPWP
jgi:hypothetical protein